MGQIAPQAPPAFLTPGEVVLARPCSQARCAYYGLYGALGRCAGCGAANEPVTSMAPKRVSVPPFTETLA